MHHLNTTCAQMDTNAHSHTSSLKAFFSIISSLCICPSLLLSLREPNCAEPCTVQKPRPLFSTPLGGPEGQTLTKTRFINIFLTKPLALNGRPRQRLQQERARLSIWGFCRFSMCLKVGHSKWWATVLLKSHASLLYSTESICHINSSSCHISLRANFRWHSHWFSSFSIFKAYSLVSLTTQSIGFLLRATEHIMWCAVAGR